MQQHWNVISGDAYRSWLPSRWLLDFSGEPDSGRTWKTADPSRLTFEIGVNRPSCRNARPWRNNDDCSFLVNQGNSFRPQCIWSWYLVRPSRESSLSYFSLSHSPSSAYVKMHWQIWGTRTDLSRDQILFLSVCEWFVVRSRNDRTVHSDENERWNNLCEILANVKSSNVCFAFISVESIELFRIRAVLSSI